MSDQNLRCDFCSVPGPAWRYPARSFVAYCAANIAGESVGDWAACDECHALIESEDWQRLTQRSLDELIMNHPEAIAAATALYEDLAALHQKFLEYRTGPPTPLGVSAV